MKKKRYIWLSVLLSIILTIISTIVIAVAPSTTLDSPSNNHAQKTGNITLTCTAMDDAQIINLTLFHNISGSWTINETIENSLFIVDVAADVWKSNDLGKIWLQIEDNYNGPDIDNASSIAADNKKYVYIIDNQKVWRSIDKGLNWVEINSDFSPSDNNPGLIITANYNNNLYIVDGSENIFKSTDSGENWNKVNDSFNNENNDTKGMTANQSNVLFIIDEGREVWKSTDEGITWTKATNNYGGGDSIQGMSSDSKGNLYVVNNQEVWKSNNSGVDWFRIVDDFNGGAKDNGLDITTDANDYIYIIDEKEQIFRSIDYGNSFEKVSGNVNGGNGNLIEITSFRAPGIPINTLNYTKGFNFNNLENGSYSWNCLVYDNESLSSWGLENYTFTIDQIKPETTLVNPSNDSTAKDEDIPFECSATDNHNLEEVSLYHNATGTWESKETKTISGKSNSTTFTINNIPNKISFVWNCLTKDQAGNLDWNNNNWTLHTDYIIEENPSVGGGPDGNKEIKFEPVEYIEPQPAPRIEFPEENELKTEVDLEGEDENPIPEEEIQIEEPEPPTTFGNLRSITGNAISVMQDLPVRVNWMILILIIVLIFLIRELRGKKK